MQAVIKKYWYLLLIIVVGVVLWYWPRDDSPVSDIDKYVNKINSLQSEIDSITTLRDSIDQRIDTITITIEKTHIKYEKDRSIILSNTASEDYVFFLEYIRDNKARLDSINHL